MTGAECDTTGTSPTNQCKCGDGYNEVVASKTCGESENSKNSVNIFSDVINTLKLLKLSKGISLFTSPI